MEVSDLMIGNWVLVNGIPMQIQAINDIDGEIMAGDELYCLIEDRVHSEDKIKPIPLTAEILEKNGFVPDKFSPYYLPIEDGSVRFFNHQYGLYCNILRPYQRYDGVCNYVHNLQHALKLCRIDKTIEL